MTARFEVVAMDERQQLRALTPITRQEPASAELLEVSGASTAPGFADLEAAVELVRAGLASRVILTNFVSWPGLLWQVYQLSVETGLQILATTPRGEGRVDIVVCAEPHNERA
jgi:hypothetical protein